jgi:hypothetical protein
MAQSESTTQDASGESFEKLAKKKTSFIGGFFGFFSRKWWLLPPLIVLLLLGAIFMLSGTVAAPFIYTLF